MVEVVVVVEDAPDALIACHLADRVILEEGPEWIDSAIIDSLRSWVGLEPGSSYTKWTKAKEMHKEGSSPRYLGHINGKPQGVEYAECRRAIHLTNKYRKAAKAVLLIKDLDNHPERREGMVQARDTTKGITIIIATPNPEREAWVLNGFEPRTQNEENELESVRREIRFDPCLKAEKLGGAPDRDPKKTLDRLTNGRPERKEECWTQTSLSTLRTRGEKTHLREYLDEVKLLLALLGE